MDQAAIKACKAVLESVGYMVIKADKLVVISEGDQSTQSYKHAVKKIAATADEGAVIRVDKEQKESLLTTDEPQHRGWYAVRLLGMPDTLRLGAWNGTTWLFAVGGRWRRLEGPIERTRVPLEGMSFRTPNSDSPLSNDDCSISLLDLIERGAIEDSSPEDILSGVLSNLHQGGLTVDLDTIKMLMSSKRASQESLFLARKLPSVMLSLWRNRISDDEARRAMKQQFGWNYAKEFYEFKMLLADAFEEHKRLESGLTERGWILDGANAGELAAYDQSALECVTALEKILAIVGVPPSDESELTQARWQYVKGALERNHERLKRFIAFEVELGGNIEHVRYLNSKEMQVFRQEDIQLRCGTSEHFYVHFPTGLRTPRTPDRKADLASLLEAAKQHYRQHLE